MGSLNNNTHEIESGHAPLFLFSPLLISSSYKEIYYIVSKPLDINMGGSVGFVVHFASVLPPLLLIAGFSAA